MTAIKYRFAKDTKSLNVIINSALESTTTARKRIQVALVATIKHTYEHGDKTGFTTLINGLGNSVNTSAVLAHIAKHTKLTFDYDKGVITGAIDKAYIKSQFDNAKKVMWWTLATPANKKPATKSKGFDLSQKIEALLKQVDSTLKNATVANVKDIKIDKEQLAKLRALAKIAPASVAPAIKVAPKKAAPKAAPKAVSKAVKKTAKPATKAATKTAPKKAK